MGIRECRQTLCLHSGCLIKYDRPDSVRDAAAHFWRYPQALKSRELRLSEAMMEPTLESANRITLRPATPADEAFELDLYTGTRWDELKLISWSDIQKQTFLKMQFTARQQQYCRVYPLAIDRIILQDSQGIGRLLVDQEERYLVLIDIALLPAHQNRGIGTMLVQSLLEEAAAAGKSVRLHVLATNPAVRMYERLGFTTTGEDGTYLEMKCLGQKSVCSP
jgi:GNAT superfamily N-acetyltransferase